MEFVSESVERGVREQRFDLEVEGETVPGILWTPQDWSPAPLILIGHGGTQHKRVDNVLALARRFVRHLGYAAVAVDAPGHGDRIKDPGAAAEARRNLQARIASGPGRGGPPLALDSPEWVERVQRGVREWKATVDALEAEGMISEAGLGYWGVSMGTLIGLPFVAQEPRVTAAVLGLAGLSGRAGGADFEAAARRLQIPVLFVFQWDDELMSRQSGLDLFDAIGSSDKAMHIHPGGHVNTPLYEREIYNLFFQRHLGAGVAASAVGTGVGA